MQPLGFTYFYPFANIIVAISQTNPVVIQTFLPHKLQAGNIVRIVTQYNGTMPEINNQTGIATVLTNTTFSLPIDARLYSAFTYFTQWVRVAQVIPIAEINHTLTNAEQNLGPNNPLVPVSS